MPVTCTDQSPHTTPARVSPLRSFRNQSTLGRAVECQGIGFVTGSTVHLGLHPAEPGFGLAFQRLDCPGSQPIPATRQFVLPRQRRTAIGRDGIVVELVEHVVAALAGMQIDNCLITLDAPEPPGFDGSCRPVVDAILEAGRVAQDTARPCQVIDRVLSLGTPEQNITLRPMARPGLAITYHLDYGPQSPIRPQTRTFVLDPDQFATEIAGCRTFVLDSEVEALRKQGLGNGLTHHDLLVFGPRGPIDNPLLFPDECARHKILDCIGDFALLGTDLWGHIHACRTGHTHNHQATAQLLDLQQDQQQPAASLNAA
ncbi:MAG: UDP-3-O-acyl-N-acetylglucosamine deacetylase [Planctomycetaceae bacterium]